MSSTASSDSSDDQYGNFKKYKKRHQVKKRKAAAPPPTKTSPKKFESNYSALKKVITVESSDEASEGEMTIEQLIEQQKKKKPAKEIEVLNDSVNVVEQEVGVVEEDTAGPSARTRSQNSQDGKKKNNKKTKPEKKQQQHYPGKAQALIDELQSLERQQKIEEKAHQDAVEYIANKVEQPAVTVIDDGMVTILLGLITDTEFRHVIKMKPTDRFDNIFLEYGPKAGYDKPDDLNLLWDNGSEFKTIKYFDTPAKHKMQGSITLAFNPKQGTQRETREEGEIKIKLNTKSHKEPLERFIHKEMPFGEFKVKLCAELKIKPSKVRFTFDGEKVSDDDTPGELDMEDFDCVDMHVDP